MSWEWPGVPGPVGIAIASAMRGLQNYLARLERGFPVHAGVQTTDATATVLFTAEVPVNETFHLEGIVVARRTGGASGTANDGASYTVKAVAKNTAGTAIVIGTSGTAAVGESQAGWDVTVVASGNALQVKVTGAAANDIAWVGHFKTLSYGG